MCFFTVVPVLNAGGRDKQVQHAYSTLGKTQDNFETVKILYSIAVTYVLRFTLLVAYHVSYPRGPSGPRDPGRLSFFLTIAQP